MAKSVIFLDRDGVLNVVFRGDYVRHVAQFQWLPGAREAVGALKQAGWPVVVVTNQSGIARGYYTQADLETIHAAMRSDLEPYGGIDAVYFCPHRNEDACDCRKPLPGLLVNAARDMDIDLSTSTFIGDSETDMRAGRAAGCRIVAVTTGLASPEDVARWTERPDAVFPSLLEAVEWINAQREA